MTFNTFKEVLKAYSGKDPFIAIKNAKNSKITYISDRYIPSTVSIKINDQVVLPVLTNIDSVFGQTASVNTLYNTLKDTSTDHDIVFVKKDSLLKIGEVYYDYDMNVLVFTYSKMNV